MFAALSYTAEIVPHSGVVHDASRIVCNTVVVVGEDRLLRELVDPVGLEHFLVAEPF